MKLVKEIEMSQAVYESDASWSVKYDVIFTRHNEVVGPLLTRCGVTFRWSDPNGSYEDDVRAYMSALLELKRDLMVLPDKCLDFAEEKSC